MGLLDSFLASATSSNTGNAGIGGTLLSLLASERGNAGSGTPGDPAADAAAPAAPAAVSGGLSELAQRFEQSGLSDRIQSWIGSGANQPVSPDELHQAIGPQTIDKLSEQTGLPHGQLLPLLAQALPSLIDGLTPNGRLPDEAEASQPQGGQTLDV